jgi:single-strand DNA-binding protein
MTLLDNATAQEIADDVSENVSDDRAAAAQRPFPVNHVRLVGKVSQPLQTKDLPSGDLLGKWNLVVARPRRVDPVEPAGDAGDGVSAGAEAVAATRRRQSHDTFECVSFDADLIDRLSDVEQGAWLEVHGALRRRFRSGPDGRQSSYAVEAHTVAVLWRPPAAEVAAEVDPAAAADEAEPVTGAE